MFLRHLLPAAVALLGLASAQVTTDCNPMEEDCPADPALGMAANWTFASRPDSALWETVVRGVEYNTDTGAKFTINKQGDVPTLRTHFYFFFGRVEFHMKASHGTGIVSSMMLLSDNLDEIDWEFLGANATLGSTNYFGKGLQDWHNGGYHEVNTQEDYHNYTTVWTKEQLEFFIDGASVRVIKASDAVNENGTDVYPQTPMRMSLSLWAGGDPELPQGTIDWAGGETDYDAGPYDMYVRDIKIEDFGTAKEYVFSDRSGDWESIESVEGNSTAMDTINKVPEQSTSEKFNDLPLGARIAIYAGSAAVGAIIIGALIFYCIKQRRRGAEEARLVMQRADNERVEMAGFKRDGVDPDGFAERAPSYHGGMKKQSVYGSNPYGALESNASLDEKWGGPGAVMAGGVAGSGASVRSMQNPFEQGDMPSPRLGSPASAAYHDNRGPGSPQSQRSYGHGTPPPPGMQPIRTPSPGMHGQGGMQSPQPMYSPNNGNGNRGSGYSRLGSPGPQAYGARRMQQSPISPGYSPGGYQPPYRH